MIKWASGEVICLTSVADKGNRAPSGQRSASTATATRLSSAFSISSPVLLHEAWKGLRAEQELGSHGGEKVEVKVVDSN